MLHTESLPTHQGIYTPLSQAMTDSESDEEIEIHNTNKHQRQRQQQQHQQQQQLQQQQLQLQQQLQHQQQQQQQQTLHQEQQPNRSRIPPNTLALKSPHTRPTATRIVGGSQLKQPQSKSNIAGSTINNSGSGGSSYTTSMQNTFRSVMLSDLGSTAGVGGGGSAGHNVGVEFSNFSNGGEYDVNTSDNVAILGLGHQDGEGSKRHPPMSTKRRCCFIASLLLCFFAVVGFVWLIPCGNPDGTGACPAPVDRVKTHNWLNNYTKIELRGEINVVAGPRAWENNLVFLYRGDVFFPEFRPNNLKRNGIISLIGNTGAVAWYDETVDEPVAIDCTLLDVDGNGKPDCLVIDEYGELGVINSASGQWHWRFVEHSPTKLDAYDFPLILPDIDDDRVLDILLISSISLEQRTKTFIQQQEQPGSEAAQEVEARNVLRLLSGRDGRPIGDGYRVHDCSQLGKLQLEAGAASKSSTASAAALSVSFSCLRNNTEQQRSKSLAELYALITNKSIVGQRLLPASKISQHRRHGQRGKDLEPQRNVYSLSGRELIIENHGKCPDCNVTIVLTESRDGHRMTLRNFTNINMYAMVPAQLHFKNTKPSMSGFLVKFWKYHKMWTNGRHTKTTPAKQRILNSVDKNSNYTNSSSSSNSNNSSNSSSSSSSKSMNAIKDKEKIKDKSYQSKAAQQQQKQQQQQQQKQQQQQQQQQPQQRLKRETSSMQLDADLELSHQFPDDLEEFDSFEHILPIQKREAFIMPAKNQSKANGKQTSSPMKNYKMQMITETVILVLFIGADTRIENTSQSNIVQFCRNDRNEMPICQPDLTNQENSMLIADLDQDGSQELVSYMSTFVVDETDPEHDWKLVSYVRLLRLQSELPAFYDQEQRN